MDEEYDVGKAKERVGAGFRRQLVRVGGNGHKEQMNFKLELVQCCSWEKDSCGKQLIPKGREGNFEGLTSGAHCVCDETPRATAEEGNNKVYLHKYRSRFFFLNCDHKQRKKD